MNVSDFGACLMFHWNVPFYWIPDAEWCSVNGFWWFCPFSLSWKLFDPVLAQRFLPAKKHKTSVFYDVCMEKQLRCTVTGLQISCIIKGLLIFSRNTGSNLKRHHGLHIKENITYFYNPFFFCLWFCLSLFLSQSFCLLYSRGCTSV